MIGTCDRASQDVRRSERSLPAAGSERFAHSSSEARSSFDCAVELIDVRAYPTSETAPRSRGRSAKPRVSCRQPGYRRSSLGGL